MSDQSVRRALRSDARLVLIEAPAGCGKTHQGADYAREAADDGLMSGRPLIATHTHAACSVFAERTHGCRTRVDIRTLDSLIAGIAGAYHVGLGLPPDIGAWIRQQDDGYGTIAAKVAALLARHPMIATSLAQRYPIVVCDESQDSSADQHAVAMAVMAQVLDFVSSPTRCRGSFVPGAQPPRPWLGIGMRFEDKQTRSRSCQRPIAGRLVAKRSEIGRSLRERP